MSKKNYNKYDIKEDSYMNRLNDNISSIWEVVYQVEQLFLTCFLYPISIISGENNIFYKTIHTILYSLTALVKTVIVLALAPIFSLFLNLYDLPQTGKLVKFLKDFRKNHVDKAALLLWVSLSGLVYVLGMESLKMFTLNAAQFIFKSSGRFALEVVVYLIGFLISRAEVQIYEELDVFQAPRTNEFHSNTHVLFEKSGSQKYDKDILAKQVKPNSFQTEREIHLSDEEGTPGTDLYFGIDRSKEFFEKMDLDKVSLHALKTKLLNIKNYDNAQNKQALMKQVINELFIKIVPDELKNIFEPFKTAMFNAQVPFFGAKMMARFKGNPEFAMATTITFVNEILSNNMKGISDDAKKGLLRWVQNLMKQIDVNITPEVFFREVIIQKGVDSALVQTAMQTMNVQGKSLLEKIVDELYFVENPKLKPILVKEEKPVVVNVELKKEEVAASNEEKEKENDYSSDSEAREKSKRAKKKKKKKNKKKGPRP